MVQVRPSGVLIFFATLATVTLQFPHIADADFEINFAPTFKATYSGIDLYNGNLENPAAPPTPAIVLGSEVSAPTTAWTFTQLETFRESAIPNVVFVIVRIDPETGEIEGGSAQRGVNYDIAHGTVAASYPHIDNVSFSISPLGDPATASGSYEVHQFVVPETVSVYDPETDISTTSPFVDEDIEAFLENDPNIYANISSASSISFTYVADVEPPTCIENCHSNILFIPGIMGSRLHDGSEQLWEGNDEEAARLYLGQEGKSINPNIYAKELVDDFTSAPIDVAIYGSFLEDLVQMKTSGTIEDYAAVPYDWRLAVDDILGSGKEEIGGAIFYNRATSTPYIEQTLRRLAQESRTGKVMIVAHSNGGLVAKALITELGPEAKDLIDQVVFVGVPQLGTPQAIGALLHGYDSGIPLALSAERARDFAINAPMTYQLLPEAAYYQSAGASIRTPLVIFESGPATQVYIDEYGMVIGNAQELRDFLNAAEGRSVPGYDDLKNPGVGNSALLAAAEALKQSIGSSWQAPAEITVHQIAGVGEDTLAGITYKSTRKCIEFVLVKPFCKTYTDQLIYTPETVVDGDGTVVAPSALAMSTSSLNVKRWWVNLQDYNRIFFGLLPAPVLRKNHASMLEIPELRSFVLSTLLEQTGGVPSYITPEHPALGSQNRLRFILHSPLALSALDSGGNEISVSAATMPDATYVQYGEVQVITVPSGVSMTVQLTGQTQGTFTLEIEEYAAGSLTQSIVLAGVPSGENTTASLAIPGGSLSNAGSLSIDYDGDGTIDAEISADESALYETVISADLPEPNTPGGGAVVGLMQTPKLSTSTIAVATTSVTAATSTEISGAEISSVEARTMAVETPSRTAQVRSPDRVQPVHSEELKATSLPEDDSQSGQLAAVGSNAPWYDLLTARVREYLLRVYDWLRSVYS